MQYPSSAGRSTKDRGCIASQYMMQSDCLHPSIKLQENLHNFPTLGCRYFTDKDTSSGSQCTNPFIPAWSPMLDSHKKDQSISKRTKTSSISTLLYKRSTTAEEIRVEIRPNKHC